MKFFLLVGLGGFLGSVARAGIGQILQNHPTWATLLANLIGAFVIGCLAKFLQSTSDPVFMRTFWMIGLCGGFTTFSAFSLDLFDLIERDQWLLGLTYSIISVAGSLIFVWLGYRSVSLA